MLLGQDLQATASSPRKGRRGPLDCIIPPMKRPPLAGWLRHAVRPAWFWITIWVVLVVTAVSVISIMYWDWLSIESNGSTIRNIVLAAVPVGVSQPGCADPPETPHGDLATVGEGADSIRQLTAIGCASYASGSGRWLPDWLVGDVATTRLSSKRCPMPISTHSAFPECQLLRTLNSSEPPWYGPVCPVV